MSRRRYRYSSYSEMMQTPTERWRLIVIASVLLHFLVFFSVSVDVSSPVKKPVHQDIKLILQTARPVKVQDNTPAPSLAMTAPPPKIVQKVQAKPVSGVVPKKPSKPVVKKVPVKPTVVKQRYVKAAPVKPARVVKAPRVPTVPHSVGIPVQAVQQPPVSTIPDDLSNAPVVGMSVVAAPPVAPKPTPFVPKPQPVKPEPSKIAKAAPVKPKPVPVKPTPVQRPVDLDEINSHAVAVETVEKEEVENNTELDSKVEAIEAQAPPLEEIETHDVAVEKVETVKHHVVEKQQELAVANVTLAEVQPSEVRTERVYPTLIQNILEFLNAFVPLKEIVPKPSEPVETVKQTPVAEPVETVKQTPVAEPAQGEVMSEPDKSTRTGEAGNEEKIPDQYLSNDWQRATKQSVANSTAKDLSTIEKDEKLARIRFREHKDYGDIPDVAPDKASKEKSKKGKNADFGFSVGDCFVGYKSDKAEKAQKSSIDCEF